MSPWTSKRGVVEGLETPRPVAQTLPAIYRDDTFITRFTAGFDDVLAPVIATLDGLSSYLDAQLAPTDFLEWLGTWVGLTLDDGWPEQRRRDLLQRAAELYQLRGTRSGLAEHVRLLTGILPDIVESGGAAWIAMGEEVALPGDAEPTLIVRLVSPDDLAVEPGRVDALVRALKPAHLPHRVEILTASEGALRGE
jgi:phage tail-like protein